MAGTATATALAGRAGGAKAAAKKAAAGSSMGAREADRAREEQRARRRQEVRASLLREPGRARRQRYARSEAESGEESSACLAGASSASLHAEVRQALRETRERAMGALAAARDAWEEMDEKTIWGGIQTAIKELGAIEELESRLD